MPAASRRRLIERLREALNAIAAPGAPGEDGQRVADLQAALWALIDHGVIEIPDEERDALERDLGEEIDRQDFGPATKSLVDRFRTAMQVGETAAVDSDTADALNRLLDVAGLAGGEYGDRRVVRGRVVGAGPGHRVRAYDKDMRSEEFLVAGRIEAGEYELACSRGQLPGPRRMPPTSA